MNLASEFLTVCAWIQASFLMVMNHGAEAHTTGTQSHFGISEQKMKKHKSLFTILKHAPSGFKCRTKFILQFRNPASCQSREIANTATEAIFEDTKLIVVGLFNSTTTIIIPFYRSTTFCHCGNAKRMKVSCKHLLTLYPMKYRKCECMYIYICIHIYIHL